MRRLIDWLSLKWLQTRYLWLMTRYPMTADAKEVIFQARDKGLRVSKKRIRNEPRCTAGRRRSKVSS